MHTVEIANRSFLLLPAVWSASLAREFLVRAECSHVIIMREVPDRRFYYLYGKQEAESRLAVASAGQSVFDVFNLHEYTATDVFRGGDNAASLPERAVIVDDDLVIGFHDASAPREEAVKNVYTASVEQFKAYPALDAPERVAPEVHFDFFVGFRETAEISIGADSPFVINVVHAGDECQVVLIPEGIKLDRFVVALPLRENVSVRCGGVATTDGNTAYINAQYIYNGQSIGAVRRAIDIQQNTKNDSPAPANKRQNPCRSSMPDLDRYVDLTITIVSTPNGELHWTWSAQYPPILKTPSVPTSLQGSREFAAEIIKSLQTEQHRGPSALNILKNLGQQIFRLMPDELCDDLHVVHKSIGQTPSVLIKTNEHFIPWELALLDPPLDSGAPAFLACQSHLGRWLHDEHVVLPPPVNVDVRRFLAIAARYGLSAGQRELKQAIAERDTLVRRWQAIPLNADRKDVDPLCAGAPQADVIHFAVHGLSDPQTNNQSILLADRTQKLATAMIGSYKCGETPRFAFMFLNACQVGTPGTSLGQAAGFPGVVVRGGARGFIAPLWEVDDVAAQEFAEAFYEATMDRNVPVAEVLRQLRGKYDPAGTTTPLAYVYYGHPALRMNYRASNGVQP